MNEKYNELRQQARINSVRVVKLNDFLSWIGWTPKRRLYVPGLVNKPYTLKAGSRSDSAAKSFSDRTSTGRVSELFYDRRTGQKTSSGQTSGSTK